MNNKILKENLSTISGIIRTPSNMSHFVKYYYKVELNNILL